MMRDTNHAVFSLVKRLRDSFRMSLTTDKHSTMLELWHRSPPCQQVYTEAQHFQHHSMSMLSTQQRHTQPDISLLDPALQKHWDCAHNAHLGNTVIKPYSNQKVWWTCNQCPDGHLHTWSAVVKNRSRGNGCPQCCGQKVCKHNSLAARAPKVAAQWDYEANGSTPESVVARSCQPVGWLCGVCGHKWSSAPCFRVNKQSTIGCPVCAASRSKTTHPTFAQCNHTLLAEWDHNRNANNGNYPNSVRLKSHKQIFWLCIKCPAGQVHSWSASPTNRLGHSRTGCPFCAGKAACRCNSLQALYPGIAALWDHGKNKGKPNEYAARAHYCAWWVSPQRGSWKQTIKSHTQLEDQRSRKRSQQRQLIETN
ncbi:hypothetical protein ABBQ38_008284 [Trebouxia sp. C0009 RCD-2024]